MVKALTIFCLLAFFRSLQAHQLSCPFCDNKVLQRQSFYEDSLVFGLYTHRPVVPAHFLVIPKRHVERLEELTQEELLQVHNALNKIHLLSQKVFSTDPYFIHQKNGKEVGQSVPHLHFHYIGKKTNDYSIVKFVYNMIRSQFEAPLSHEELQKVTDELKTSLEALEMSSKENSNTLLKLSR